MPRELFGCSVQAEWEIECCRAVPVQVMIAAMLCCWEHLSVTASKRLVRVNPIACQDLVLKSSDKFSVVCPSVLWRLYLWRRGR